jgi:hypothetical protein
MEASQRDTQFARHANLESRYADRLGNKVRHEIRNRVNAELDVVQQNKVSLMGEMAGVAMEIKRLRREFMRERQAYAIRQAEVVALERRHAVNKRKELMLNRAKVLSQAKSFVGSEAAANAQHKARGVQLAIPWHR